MPPKTELTPKNKGDKNMTSVKATVTAIASPLKPGVITRMSCPAKIMPNAEMAIKLNPSAFKTALATYHASSWHIFLPKQRNSKENFFWHSSAKTGMKPAESA